MSRWIETESRLGDGLSAEAALAAIVECLKNRTDTVAKNNRRTRAGGCLVQSAALLVCLLPVYKI